MNLAWWLEHAEQQDGRKIAALDNDGASLTYTELVDLAARVATVLREEYGVREGDVVASLADDCGDHMAILYGVLRLGAVFTAFNPRLHAQRLGADLVRCGATVLIAHPSHRHLAAQITAAQPDTKVWLAGREGSSKLDLRQQVSHASPLAEIVPRTHDDLAAINFTAGSTGDAKGVMFTHGTLGISAQLGVYTSGITSRAVNLSLIGLYHSGGLHDAVKFVLAGGTIIWADGWDVERTIRLIRDHRPNWIFFIVPTMVRDLMRHRDWAAVDLDRVGMYVAGEPVPTDVALALDAKRANYTNAYGMTETMPFRITGPARSLSATPPGSAGRPNREFCSVVLKDPETGEVVTTPHTSGEVCVKGDIVSPGYIGDARSTAELFDGDGYLHTKDIAYYDTDGWFYLRGRADDVINCGGEKLSLAEVDELLMSSGLIADAACAGVAHERFGEVPAAFVVKVGDIGDKELAGLLDAHMIAAAERWKRPRLYAVVDAIPRIVAKGTKARHELKKRLENVVVPIDADVVVFEADSG